MNVRQLIEGLRELDPETVVTVFDERLQMECHAQLLGGPWSVTLFSSGNVVTEEDVA